MPVLEGLCVLFLVAIILYLVIVLPRDEGVEDALTQAEIDLYLKLQRDKLDASGASPVEGKRSKCPVCLQMFCMEDDDFDDEDFCQICGKLTPCQCHYPDGPL